MKKSLVKKLVRMAKDGDPEAIEAIAELLEEATEGENNAECTMHNAQLETEEKEPIEEPAAVVETEEGTTVVVDEATLGEVIARLDQIIALLTPAAGDEDPTEEIAEIVEEALEAVAPEETEDEGDPGAEMLSAEEETSVEEIAELVEEILDPLVPTDEEIGDDEDDPEEGEVLSAGDALRIALSDYKPQLAMFPRKKRMKVARDIAARLQRQKRHKAADNRSKAAKASRVQYKELDPRDLGKRIMATRNANRARS